MSVYSRSGLILASTLVLILAIVSAGCTATNPPAPTPATQPPATPGGNTITIKNFAFSPAMLTVKTGTTVTWTNNDGTTHTIIADTGAPAEIRSGTLANGATYQFTFTTPGTYTYYCSIHPSMRGTVVVQP